MAYKRPCSNQASLVWRNSGGNILVSLARQTARVSGVCSSTQQHNSLSGSSTPFSSGETRPALPSPSPSGACILLFFYLCVYYYYFVIIILAKPTFWWTHLISQYRGRGVLKLPLRFDQSVNTCCLHMFLGRSERGPKRNSSDRPAWAFSF